VTPLLADGEGVESIEDFELLVMLSIAFAGVLGVIALIDVIRRPSWQWSQAGRSKGKWIVLLVLGVAFGALGGFFLAIVYYFYTQPALKRVRQPIRPPGGSYHSTTV
jgi:hypothetical protein